MLDLHGTKKKLQTKEFLKLTFSAWQYLLSSKWTRAHASSFLSFLSSLWPKSKMERKNSSKSKNKEFSKNGLWSSKMKWRTPKKMECCSWAISFFWSQISVKRFYLPSEVFWSSCQLLKTFSWLAYSPCGLLPARANKFNVL